MYIRRGRFTWLVIVATSVSLCSLAFCVWLSATHIETDLPTSPDLFTDDAQGSIQKQDLSKALFLKAYPLTDDATRLSLSIFASKMLARPDCLKAPKAVRLYTNRPNEEHNARLGQRLYLKRQAGQFCFADPGEKTSIWVVPESEKSGVILFAEMDIAGKTEKLGEFKVPLIEGGLWPEGGMEVEGVRIDRHMFERLEAKWSGTDLFQSPDRYRLFFKTHSLRFLPQDWLVVKEGRWQVASAKDSTETKPLMRLHTVETNRLVFEVIDSDGQLHLFLPLHKTGDEIEEGIVSALGPIAFRTLGKVAINIQGSWKFLSLGQALVYREGTWEKADRNSPPLGPLLALESIEMSVNPQLVATLYSPMHSKSCLIKLPIERLRRKAP